MRHNNSAICSASIFENVNLLNIYKLYLQHIALWQRNNLAVYFMYNMFDLLRICLHMRKSSYAHAVHIHVL